MNQKLSLRETLQAEADGIINEGNYSAVPSGKDSREGSKGHRATQTTETEAHPELDVAPTRFRIRLADVGYLVSIPNYDGGEVVTAETFDVVVDALKQCLQEMRYAADLLEMFPDDYGKAINAADAVLLKVDPLYAELAARMKRARSELAHAQDAGEQKG